MRFKAIASSGQQAITRLHVHVISAMLRLLSPCVYVSAHVYFIRTLVVAETHVAIYAVCAILGRKVRHLRVEIGYAGNHFACNHFESLAGRIVKPFVGHKPRPVVMFGYLGQEIHYCLATFVSSFLHLSGILRSISQLVF